MGEWGWIILTWVTVAVVIATYAVAVIRRGRSLSRQVPEDRRRWTS